MYRLGYLTARKGTGGGLGVTVLPGTDAGGELDGADSVNSKGGVNNANIAVQGADSPAAALLSSAVATDPRATAVPSPSPAVDPPTTWHPAQPSSTHGLPTTLVPHPTGGFLSLAPRAHPPGKGKLDVLYWGSAALDKRAYNNPASDLDGVKPGRQAEMDLAPHLEDGDAIGRAPDLDGATGRTLIFHGNVTIRSFDLDGGTLDSAPNSLDGDGAAHGDEQATGKTGVAGAGVTTPRPGAGGPGPPTALDPLSEPSGPPTVFASLTNARHPPLGPLGGGVLGYVGDASDGRVVYASLTVDATGLLGVRDRWSVARVDLRTRVVTESVLRTQPAVLGAETCSLAGFGIA